MVKNVRALIDTEQYEEAADVILQAIATIINTNAVMISVSKKDLLTIGPALISMLSGSSGSEGSEGGEEEPTTPEKTEAPGDDIEVSPSTGTLTITFVGPEDDHEIRVPSPIVRNYLIGQYYKFTPHSIKGYTVSPTKITGVMTAEGVNAEFTYTAIEEESGASGSGGTSESGTSGGTSGTGGTSGGTSEAGAAEGTVSGGGAELP